MAGSPEWPVIGVGPVADRVQALAWAVPPLTILARVRWAAATTVTGAVWPVPMTTYGLWPAAPAWFVYVPGVVDTVTPKVSVIEPEAGTENGPFQVRD